MSRIEQRASLVTLAAADLERLTAYYREGFGWTPAFVNDEVVFFQLPGLVLGLWSRSHMAQELNVPATALGPGGMELAHNVRQKEDVDAAISQAVQAGGAALVEAHDTKWGGRSGHVADPEGHRWEIAWNPFWEISPEGFTSMRPDA